MSKSRPNAVLFVVIALTVAAIVLAPQFLTPRWSMTVVYVTIAAFIMAVGQLVGGTPWAVFISQLNTMSLSRVQTVLWTVLIVGSFITAAFATMQIPQIPETLLGLIGVSLGSSVAASMVMSNKASKNVSSSDVQESVQRNGSETTAQGAAFAYTHKKYASLADIFEGDEVADAHTFDLAKVQMFFFTLAGAVVYVGQVYAGLVKGNLTALPNLPQELIILMGMSHAGYIGGKAVGRTPQISDSQAQAESVNASTKTIVSVSQPVPAGTDATIPVAKTT